MNLCLCGCELEVTLGKFKRSHKTKYLASLPDKFCECGCNGIVNGKRRFVKGHNGILNKGMLRSDKVRKKISESLCDKKHTVEHNQKISEALKGRVRTVEHNQKISEALKGRVRSETHKKNLSISASGKNCLSKLKKEKNKTKMSKLMKERWSDPAFAEKMVASFNGIKNKAESRLEIVLNGLYPNQYKYVGDRSFWVARMNPDFISIPANDKRVIEMYGDWFHRSDHPEHRIESFKKYGYNALIIWSHELDYLDKLKQKIIGFQENNINDYEFSSRVATIPQYNRV